jgi:RNA polymerase sigma factor (sigma-70 family)
VIARNNGVVDTDRSFERLYRRHRREVYGAVMKDVRDPDEAEDVTQVAFLNAYAALRRGDRPEKPRAWLLAIARNVVRRRARLRAERPQEVELDPELLGTLDDVEESASHDICAALRRLTDAQREAILLREIQGRTYAEIAEALVLSVPAVEALLFRARRALADELALADRAPVVRRRKGYGVLALPGLAKLGSFGFSFGRVGAACLVGCAAIVTMPIGGRDASGEPGPAALGPTRHAVVPTAAPKPADLRNDGHRPKRRPAETTSPDGGKARPAEETTGTGASTLVPLEPVVDSVAHILKTPKVVSGIGALTLAAIPRASTLRVSTGSTIPSSQSLAVE